VGGGKGGSGGRCYKVSCEGRMEVCMMGRDDESLLNGSEGVRGRIVLTFPPTRLQSPGLCGF